MHYVVAPLPKTPVPVVRRRNVVRANIDRFILAALERGGLRPGRLPASERLLRRVDVDLIGLPPTPEEVDDYLRDDSPAASSVLWTASSQSPMYGERWGSTGWTSEIRGG